jgi:hypothetical protein
MHGSRSKIPSKKNLISQRYAEGFNSGVKGLISPVLGDERSTYPLLFYSSNPLDRMMDGSKSLTGHLQTLTVIYGKIQKKIMFSTGINQSCNSFSTKVFLIYNRECSS